MGVTPGQLSLFVIAVAAPPPPPPALTTSDIDRMFAEFYRAYPRRVGKRLARKTFETIMRNGEATFEQVMEGVHLYVEECRRRGTQPHFVAHPSSWLNAGRWDDEHAPAVSAATASAARIGLEYRQARDGQR